MRACAQVHEEFVRVMFVEMLFWKGPKNAEYIRDGYKALEPFDAPGPRVGLGDDDDDDAVLADDAREPAGDAVDPEQVSGLHPPHSALCTDIGLDFWYISTLHNMTRRQHWNATLRSMVLGGTGLKPLPTRYRQRQALGRGRCAEAGWPSSSRPWGCEEEV